MSPAAIRTEGLSKTFGTTEALVALDLEVAGGRGARLPGPERRRQDHHDPAAARPDPGHRRAGPRSSASTARRDPVERPSPPRVRARRGEPVAVAHRRRRRCTCSAASRAGSTTAYRDVLVERFDFDPSKKVRAYSKGNRQKLILIAGLMSRADLLLLDEPTSGLDPLMEQAFRGCVDEARERGQTVFLSSHILSEVEALCDRIAILRAGHLVEVGTLAEMRHLSALSVEAELDGTVPDLSNVPGVSAVEVDGNRVRCQVTGSIEPLLERARRAPACAICVSREPSLEELFLAHYGARRGGSLRCGVGGERSTASVARRRRSSPPHGPAGRPAGSAVGAGLRGDDRRVGDRPTRGSSRRRPPAPRSRVVPGQHRVGGAVRSRSAGSTRWPATPSYKSGMTVIILGAIWGLLIATRSLRGEEDAGRWELFLSGRTTRGRAAVQAAIGLGVGFVAAVAADGRC